MTTFDQAVRAVQQHGAQFQPTLRSWVAYLGDGVGNVVSDTAKNRYFCRYPAADSPSSEVYAAGCPPIDGMRVMVGYSADQPKLVRVLSWTDPALENTVFPLQHHGDQHAYLAGDTVWVDWRQITTLKVQPYSGLLVYVNGGILPRSGVDTYVLPQVVDMSGSVPNTINQGRYALLSLDTSGAVVITNGTPVTPGMSLDISSVPDTPSGNFRLAAVQLVYGQTTIQETTSRCDILDLRWPQETIAGSLAPGSIGGATAQYQYIVSGAGPAFIAQWSNGYLAITSGKTLTVNNTLTLAGSSDGFTLTVPATGTAAVGAGTLDISTTDDVTLAAHTHAITASSNVGVPPYASLLKSESSGGLQLGSFLAVGYGSASAASGGIRLPNNETINWRNAGGTGDIQGFRFDSSSQFIVGNGCLYIFGGGGTTTMYISSNNGLVSIGDGATFPTTAKLYVKGGSDLPQLLVKGYTTQTGAIEQITDTNAGAGIQPMTLLTRLGSGANGDGGSVTLAGKSSTTAAQSMGILQWLWADATHATRKARITSSVYDTAAREWLQVDTNGSVSSVQINSLLYGSMYADDIAQVVTITGANTEAKVTAGLSGGTCNGFTFQNSRELLCSVAGSYKVDWGMSVSSATNNENLSGGVVINTVTWQHNTEGSSNQNNSNNAVHIGGSGVITLAVNDTVGLFVENESGAHDITIRHANLSLVRIGV